jgi:hypothetical protein
VPKSARPLYKKALIYNTLLGCGEGSGIRRVKSTSLQVFLRPHLSLFFTFFLFLFSAYRRLVSFKTYGASTSPAHFRRNSKLGNCGAVARGGWDRESRVNKSTSCTNVASSSLIA